MNTVSILFPSLCCRYDSTFGHVSEQLYRSFQLTGNSLVLEEAVKDLVLHLDKRMTFTALVDNMICQLSGILGYLSGIRYSLTGHATRLLVKSLVLGKVSYCSAVWGGICKTDGIKLQRIINFAARVIFNDNNNNTNNL